MTRADPTSGRSEGRRVLRVALASVGVRALARRIGASPAAVSLWASGDRRPSYPAREALAREIPALAPPLWDEPAQFTHVNTAGANGEA